MIGQFGMSMKSKCSQYIKVQWSLTYPDLAYPNYSLIQIPVWGPISISHNKVTHLSGNSVIWTVRLDKWGSTVLVFGERKKSQLAGINFQSSLQMSLKLANLTNPKSSINMFTMETFKDHKIICMQHTSLLQLCKDVFNDC